MATIPPDSRTVLIIEADADARATLAHLLQLHGYMVIAVGSDQEALDELQTSANSPAVVFVDLDTPSADWQEFLARKDSVRFVADSHLRQLKPGRYQWELVHCWACWVSRRRLRDEGDIGNPKVIVISGRDPRVIPDAVAVLPKPVEVPELLGLLHQLLRRPEADGMEN